MFQTMSKKCLLVLCIALVASFSFMGCDNDDQGEKSLEIVGTYDNNFGGQDIISVKDWTFQSGMSWAFTEKVIEYDNYANVLYSQDPSDGKIMKIAWTEKVGGVFYYCMVSFDHDTIEAARSDTTSYDDSDPANSGCGGFSWTKLTEVN